MTEQRVAIGIVGLNFGETIVRQLTEGRGRDLFKITTLCDLDLPKARAMAASIGARATDDYDSILADPEIEAVGIFTPPAGRAAMIGRALNAGKHVMTTKPFEVDSDAAWDVLRQAHRLGLAVHLNSPSPVSPPDLAQIAEWHSEYALGAPIACRADIWCRYHEEPSGTWYDDPARCPAAPIFRIGVYLINDLARLFGEASHVSVFTSRLFTNRPTPDNAQLSIKFRNGGLANVLASFCVLDGDNHRNHLTLNYENGTIYRNCGPVHALGTRDDTALGLVMCGDEGGFRLAAEKLLTEYNLHDTYRWDVFHDAVRGQRRADEIGPETIVAGIRMIEAMAEAERTGKVVEVRPVEPAGSISST